MSEKICAVLRIMWSQTSCKDGGKWKSQQRSYERPLRHSASSATSNDIP